MSPPNIRAIAPSLWEALLDSSLPEQRRPDDPAQAAFLAILLKEAEGRAVARKLQEPVNLGAITCSLAEAVKGETSGTMESSAKTCVLNVWEAYADKLLAEDFACHPYCRAATDPAAMRTNLEPSAEPEYVIGMVEDIIAAHSSLKEKKRRTHFAEAIELGMFFRAKLSMLTRAFQTCCDSSLVPVVDLFNHSPGTGKGVIWRWDETARAMVVTANRAHAAGEELLDSYGLRSNAIMYRTYGFTQLPAVEPHWTFCMTPIDILPVIECLLPADYKQVSIYLETMGLEKPLQTALNAATQNGTNPAEFLEIACARCKWRYEQTAALRPALEALRRVRCEDPKSHAWWERLAEGEEDKVADDAVRVKMCEYLCLVAHLEAVKFAEGALREEHCLTGGKVLRQLIADALSNLKQRRLFAVSDA